MDILAPIKQDITSSTCAEKLRPDDPRPKTSSQRQNMRSRLCHTLFIPLIPPCFPLLLCALLSFVGCSTKPATPIKEAPPRPITEVIFEEDQPVRLALEEDRRAPGWLEPAASKYAAPSLGPASLITFGERVSLHRTPQGIIAVHAERGVIGPVSLPAQSTWVGIDGADRIWVGKHDDGTLLMASDAEKARSPEGFTLIKTIPGARAWDVQGERVVVATEQVIHVGTREGKQWKERTVKDLDRILQVYAGTDGVLVAQGESEMSRGREIDLPDTRISRDGGISWELSSYQPGKLKRHGSWIWSGDPTCVATLASDGVSWSADPDLTHLPGYHDPREKMLSLTSELHVVADPSRIATSETPAPPQATQPLHRGVQANCQDPILTNLATPPAEEEETDAGRGPKLEPCQGAACLRQSRPAATPTTHQLYMLADGTCQWRDEATRRSDPGCTPEMGSKLLSSPHLVLWERVQDTFTMHAPPAGCIPEKSFSSSGLHMILCRSREDAAALWTMRAEPDARWQEEAILPTTASRISNVSSTSDGTLILHGACDAQRCETSYLRAPGEVGEQDLWRALEVDGALMTLPVPGGRAIVASEVPGSTQRMMLWWASFDEDRLRPLIEVTGLEEPVLALSLDDTQQHITLTLGTVMRNAQAILMSDGSLRMP